MSRVQVHYLAEDEQDSVEDCRFSCTVTTEDDSKGCPTRFVFWCPSRTEIDDFPRENGGTHIGLDAVGLRRG